MTQKEILEWAMSGLRSAWLALYEQEKTCAFPDVKKVIRDQQMSIMKKFMEVGKMLDELKEEK